MSTKLQTTYINISTKNILNAARLVECISSISKALTLILSITKASMAAHAYNPNTEEVEVRGSEVQGQHCLHSEFSDA